MKDAREENNQLVISYLALRKAIGYLGIALPFVLSLGGAILFSLAIQSSISRYYYTDMRDIFVGTMCAIGVFLMSYRGYERKDAIAGKIACLTAVGLALVPTAPSPNPTSHETVLGYFHLAFAVAFFLTLAYFSIFLFTKTHAAIAPTRKKLQRNVVYKICGYTILVAIALILYLALAYNSVPDTIKRLEPIFWLESIAILAFGISWMTKGEVILKD